jgi:tetratricopeptide (TPR) repeat protein
VRDPVATDSQAAQAVRPAGAVPRAVTARHPDLIIARIHLRMGSLGIARAELETLAGRDLLDDDGVRDLAEARWRTGDITGAGEAAVAFLEAHDDDVLALAIAAEAQADLGRPAEARRLAGRALELAAGSLDPIFAGMPRSQVWPVDADGAGAPAGVLFDDLHPGPMPTTPSDGPVAWRWGQDADDEALDEMLESRLPPVVVGGPSLWGDDDLRVAAAALDPTTLFHAGRVALEQGRTEDAATGLILALRSAPGLAPAVLDLLVGRADPILVLVRGDAQRIVGREAEGLRDHAAAAGRLTADEAPPPPSAESPEDPVPDDPDGQPATTNPEPTVEDT